MATRSIIDVAAGSRPDGSNYMVRIHASGNIDAIVYGQFSFAEYRMLELSHSRLQFEFVKFILRFTDGPLPPGLPGAR